MRKGRFGEEQIINVKGGPAAAQLHLTPRRNRFRQRPVQVRTRLSAGGGSLLRTRLGSEKSRISGGFWMIPEP
jgi:hypothetical protein